MSRTIEELTAHIDHDFKEVIDKLKGIFIHVASEKHGRATHTYGVAAHGSLRVVVPQGFPESDFFTAGKVYPIILRHSRPGGFFNDDRVRDGAAASIKFFESGSLAKGSGMTDIMMNTGRTLFVNSARSFLTMVTTPNDQRVEKLLKTGILNDQILSEGYRDSGSFTDYRYHTQICFEYTDDSLKKRYLRFRMINADRGPERGCYPPSFRPLGVTASPPLPDDTRAPDYLRQDFINRVKRWGVYYLLQVQIRPADDPAALNCSGVWDETYYPWQDAGEIHLTELLSHDEMDQLEFDANRTHPSINLPLATSANDHASLGHSRALVYWAAREARAKSPMPHVV
jgi:hypothetical protein